ncbi:MAG: ATP-binding protein [Bacteroidia bacterium]|nr:ATP-binding protein [Bacteroidia bacterium]
MDLLNNVPDRSENEENADKHFRVVGFGASSGGLEAFQQVLGAISPDSGMAYVLVQHLDPSHHSLLTEILHKATSLQIGEITNDVLLKPNHIYVIPNNRIVKAEGTVLKLAIRPKKDNPEYRFPIDYFFKSLAEVYGRLAVGVVLSGNGKDGTLGLEAIQELGGSTFAQDENTAANPEMPRNAREAGVVDYVLPPESIPAKLLELWGAPQIPDNELDLSHVEIEKAFRQIIHTLFVREGTDFTHYKQTTIRRRVLRRIAINKNSSVAEYLHFLNSDRQEQELLYQDLLIQVTNFFRDPEVFEHLSSSILPSILKSVLSKEGNEASIRVWVAGCSSGEEAYSLAICLTELLDTTILEGKEILIQIFATDLSEPAIIKARRGIYSKAEISTVSEQRLQTYFTQTKNGYEVKKEIRALCVFAHHNFLKDPPFSRMDLISCRNVLIYLEPYLQKKALTTFHYALNPKGFLLLGRSESTSGVLDHYTLSAKQEKIYTRKDVPGRFVQITPLHTQRSRPDIEFNPMRENPRSDFQKIADDILLSKYSPAGVIINDSLDIVQFRGSTSPYLEQGPGKPSHNLISMARQGLAFELRNLVHKVRKTKAAVSKDNIPVSVGGKLKNVSIEAIPLPNTIDPHYLILFLDHVIELPEVSAHPINEASDTGKKDARIKLLEEELAQTREDMRSITEDQEAANEELQSTNEELLSSSEELQSLNEELETSKEELNSTNEKLTLLNYELQELNDELESSKNFSESIVANIREPLLVLDQSFRVKKVNDAFFRVFGTPLNQTGDEIIYSLEKGQWDVPALRTLLEELLPQASIVTDFEITHSFPRVGKLILLINAREIVSMNSSEKLILLSIRDITAQKIQEITQKELVSRFQNLIKQTPSPICIFKGEELILEVANDAALKIWGKGEEVIGQPFLQFTPEMKDQPFVGYLLEVLRTGVSCYKEEESAYFINQDGEQEDYYFSFVYQPFRESDGTLSGVMTHANDISNQVRARNKLKVLQEEHTKELEAIIQDRTKALIVANEELQKKNKDLLNMNQDLETFAHISSHDLQEPLRKIQTLTGRILDKEKQALSDKGLAYFDMMQKEASRMQALIGDLLTFTQLSTADQRHENISIRAVLDEVLITYWEVMEASGASLELHGQDMVWVIPFQFRQLIQNLISNSLKYAKADHPALIVIQNKVIPGSESPQGLLIADKSYTHISVTDNGIGFEAEFSEKIFTVFQRLHTKDEYPGTGIGLAIVKKIVDNHQGVICASSVPGQGSTFDIYLPIQNPT